MKNYLKENLPGVSMTYATDLVDEIEAVKSAEELEIIKETARMQDIVWGAVPAMVRPGVTEYEIRSEIQRLLLR